MRRKSERGKLIARLDKVFSQYIIHRDKQCVVCGSARNLQCGHYFSRGHYSTRWDEINANCQCAGCNIAHEYNPEPYRRFMVAKYGDEALTKLERKYNTVSKFKDYEIQYMIDYFRSLI